MDGTPENLVPFICDEDLWFCNIVILKTIIGSDYTGADIHIAILFGGCSNFQIYYHWISFHFCKDLWISFLKICLQAKKLSTVRICSLVFSQTNVPCITF